MTEAFDRGEFLGSSLVVGERMDILFEVFGSERRLVPDELAELAPVLERACPDLFGSRTAASSRVIRLRSSPVEPIATAFERLSSAPVLLGPAVVLRKQVEQFVALVDRSQSELKDWVAASVTCRPILGPTQRHFDALREMCCELEGSVTPHVLLTTAFLSVSNLSESDGLADVLTCTRLTPSSRSSTGTPAMICRNSRRPTWPNGWRPWKPRPSLKGQLHIAAGERRSHEKVVITSCGGWLIGSWNPGSSRPHATVFECSLRGENARIARDLLERVAANVPTSLIDRAVAQLSVAFKDQRVEDVLHASDSTRALVRAATVLSKALPQGEAILNDAWTQAIRAVCEAVHPVPHRSADRDRR